MRRDGVEPTKSPGSRPGRFSCLRTQSVAFVIPCTRKCPVQVLHLAAGAYDQRSRSRKTSVPSIREAPNSHEFGYIGVVPIFMTIRLRWPTGVNMRSALKADLDYKQLQTPVTIRDAGLMKASRAPALPAVTKGRVELPSPRGARRSERRVSTSCTTWPCLSVTRAGFEPALPA